MRKRRAAVEAFTLVELLVVVAIIAMLVSILMPSLRRAYDLARVAICGSNLKTVGTGIREYMEDMECNEAWRWTDGGYDHPWEWARGRMDSRGRLVPKSWGNPAIALTDDFGRGARVRDDGFASPHNSARNYAPGAKVFFCPLASYSYEKHYRRHGLEGLPLNSLPYVWGTYQWNYHIDRDESGRDRRPDQFNHRARDLLMMDYSWYGATEAWEQYVPPYFWHYNALMLQGNVKRLSDKTKEVWEWMWGPQPSSERRVRDYRRTYTLHDGVQ